MNKKTVLIIYPYFYPGFKAGGPIQSLINMIEALQDSFKFKVLTTAHDLNEPQPYANVLVDQWTPVTVGKSGKILVWYNATLQIGIRKLRKLVVQSKADTIFVNGLFTKWSFLPLLLFHSKSIGHCRMIISPRGMLQDGALKSGALKKRVYLAALKLAGLYNGIIWHATSSAEKSDVTEKTGMSTVIVAENIPKSPIEIMNVPIKRVGELRLVYLSLITEKKNLKVALDSLSTIEGKIFLDIFGPIKDLDYWKKCLTTMQQLPNHIQVTYRGEVKPHNVQSTIEQYHALISLTKGENFGHALFESLSVGRPLITSHFTPWNNLEFNRAGWNIDISNSHMVSSTLQKIVDIDQKVWDEICVGAWNLSKSYFANASFQKQYQELFG